MRASNAMNEQNVNVNEIQRKNDDENNKNNRNEARDGDRAIRVVRHAGRISPFPTE